MPRPPASRRCRDRGSGIAWNPGRLAPREPKSGNGRRRLQPAAGRRDRDHVAVAVDDIDMDGVAALFAKDAPWSARRPRRVPNPAASISMVRSTALRSPAILPGRRSSEAVAPISLRRSCRVGRRTADASIGTSQKCRVAVVDLAVGKGEFHGLRDRVDEVGADGIHRGEVEVLQNRERLQEDRSLAPGAGLGDGPAVVIIGQRRLRRSPTSSPCRRRSARPCAGCRWRP